MKSGFAKSRVRKPRPPATSLDDVLTFLTDRIHAERMLADTMPASIRGAEAKRKLEVLLPLREALEDGKAAGLAEKLPYYAPIWKD